MAGRSPGTAASLRDRRRRALMENKDQIADPHLVVLLEPLAAGDLLLVEERAVAAAEVLDDSTRPGR